METSNCTHCNLQAEDIKKAFNFLTSDEAEKLCPYLELREWEKDAIVMKEGEFGDYMGFVVDGKLAVKKQTDYWGKQIIIAILDRGTMVGEGAFIVQGPRSNTVVTMEKSKLLILTAGRMDGLVLNSPMLAIKLLKHMLHIMSLRLRKAGDRISEVL